MKTTDNECQLSRKKKCYIYKFMLKLPQKIIIKKQIQVNQKYENVKACKDLQGHTLAWQ